MRLLLISCALCLGACAMTPSTASSDASSGEVGAVPAYWVSPQEATPHSQTLASQEALTPYASEMTYPSNWVEITRKRQ